MLVLAFIKQEKQWYVRLNRFCYDGSSDSTSDHECQSVSEDLDEMHDCGLLRRVEARRADQAWKGLDGWGSIQLVDSDGELRKADVGLKI